MRTYNARAARLRALADALDAGTVDADDVRIMAQGPAESAIIRSDAYEENTTMTVTVNHPTNRPNYCEVQVGPLWLAFSYRTPIAFRHPDINNGAVIVRENDWGPTTGKHLNEAAPRGAERIPGTDFERLLSEVMP